MRESDTVTARPAVGGDAPVVVSVLSDVRALASRRGEWNALVERGRTNTVFQTYEFHASWWSVFGADARALVIIAEREGKLVGIAPLMASASTFLGRTTRVVQFIGTRSFDYCDFIVDRENEHVLPLLLSRLVEGQGEFDLLYLRDIASPSRSADEVRAFFNQRGFPTDVRVLYEAPTRVFNDPAADRQLPNKKSLKRHYNYFKRSGKLEFRHCRSAEEVAPYLDAFFEQHVRRRAVTDTPSVFVDGRMRAFFSELASTLAPNGWLLFTVVLFNDEPIAMHYGFEYGGRITWYKPAFEMEHAKHSPGEVLIKCLLEYALERKVQELDFTIGEEAFKYRFANHARPNYAVRVHRRWTSHQLSRLVLNARLFVERYPAATRFARRALARWRGQPWI